MSGANNDTYTSGELSAIPRPRQSFEVVVGNERESVRRGAMILIEQAARAMGVAQTETATAPDTNDNVQPTVPMYAEAEHDVERVMPISSKRDQASTLMTLPIDDGQPAIRQNTKPTTQEDLANQARQLLAEEHDRIAAGQTHRPLITPPDAETAQILAFPFRREGEVASVQLNLDESAASGDVDQIVQIPFADIPEVPQASSTTQQAA